MTEQEMQEKNAQKPGQKCIISLVPRSKMANSVEFSRALPQIVHKSSLFLVHQQHRPRQQTHQQPTWRSTSKIEIGSSGPSAFLSSTVMPSESFSESTRAT